MPKVTWTIDADLSPLEKKLKKADKQAEKTGEKFSNLGGLGTKALGFLGGGLALGGLAAATTGLAKMGGELETTRLQFATFLGSVDKGNKMLDELSQFANLTPFSNQQVNKAAKTLLSFGLSADQVKPTLKILGDVSAGTGKDLSELGVIYGQIRGAGRLMGQDLLQLINAGFNPLQQISQRTGKSMGELKDDMSKGLISFDDVRQAFVDATSEGGLFNNLTTKLSTSFQGKLSTALGKGRFLLQKIGEKQLPVFNKGLDAAIGLIDAVAGEEEKRSSVMQREIAISNGLFNALSKSNMEAGERKRLLDEVNKRYGEYLPNLLTEKSSIDEVRMAQDKLTESLKKQLAVQLKQEAQRELLERKAKAATRLAEIQLQQAGISALQGVTDQEARAEIARAFELPQFSQSAVARLGKNLEKSQALVESNLNQINESIKRSDKAFADTFGDISNGNQGSDAGFSGAVSQRGIQGGIKRTSVGTGISGGKDIKNFQIDISSLVENITFESTGGESDQELQDRMTRVLVGAVNNFERLAGG